ncbi:MAG: hypothetical protein ACNI27_07335 [Desulfovibrio sp.]
MGIFNTVLENRDLILAMLGAIVSVASLFVAGTPTPDPATPLGKAYKLIEWAALNFGKAKESGKSMSVPPVTPNVEKGD